MGTGSIVDGLATPPSDECSRQVQRILQSQTFRNAATLQQLLQFLTVRALGGGDPEPLKEYIIGVEAFGRPQDFDPKTDTIVRVQIHRLRQKLKEYYESDGRTDPVLVDIPKGHYLPRFEAMSESQSEVEDVRRRETPTQSHGVAGRAGETKAGLVAGGKNVGRRWPTLGRLLLAVGALIGVFASGILIGTKRKAFEVHGTSVHDYATGADPVKAFWASFIGDDPTPVIAYPDAVFLLDNSNDLFRFRQGASDDRGALVDPHLAHQFASNPKLVNDAGALFYENGYTGTGELQAVGMFSSLFGQMGIRPIIKPSRDITPVDLHQHNVILLGSTFQNVAVAQFMTAGDFSFRNPDLRLEQWRAEIVNTQPRAPEAATYHTERDSATHVLKADYAIVTFQKGMVSGRHIAILGGLDTTGTEGAAMFFTSRTGVEEVQKALTLTGGPSQTVEMPQFQALLHVQLEKGYEVLGAALVTVHKINSTNAPSTENGTASAHPR